jgi:malonyl-CoA O-methyltransferase
MNSAVTALPDKSEVRFNFSKAAGMYDRYADHHRLIADRLIDYAPPQEAIDSILEIGCGTGILSDRLQSHYPDTYLTLVDISPAMVKRCRSKLIPSERLSFQVADAEEYCRAGSSFDLVTSSCSIQWFHDRDGFVRNLRNTLSYNGFCLMAIPIRGMLFELMESCSRGASKPLLQLDLDSAERWISIFNRNGFKTAASSVERVSCIYKDPLEVLKAIRGIGAGIDQGSVSMKPGEMKRMAEYYREQYKVDSDGRVSSTYMVLYFKGMKI